MCNGYWEACNCKECKKVSDLYEELDWLEKDKDFNKDEIKEIENKIESMGYFI
jgi:hypothetical protein